MNKQNVVTPKMNEVADAGAGSVEWLPFADLRVSDLNQRSVIDEDAIAKLAENIRDKGLIQNLAGLREADGAVGIVAGGRRLRALALVQDDPRFHLVPVKVTGDAQVAKAWAASENHLREGLHPADEIREYGAMAKDGVPVPAIALAFGVSEPHVYRRLKLAGLPEPVLAALKADGITLAMATCFTLCEDEAHALAVLERVRHEPVSEHVLKRMLKPDSVKSTDRRALFVGEAAYTEAGGRLTRDLFTEETLFDDAEILDQVFREKLEQAADEIQSEEGWKWAEACFEPYLGWYQIEERKMARVYPEPGMLDEDQQQRFDDLAELAESDVLDAEGMAELADLQAILDGTFSEVQKALSGAMVYVDHDGDLSVCGGLIAKEDRAAAEAAGILQPSQHGKSDTAKPAISAKLQDDLNRVATGARQNAVLDHPDLLLDLLAFQLSGRMGSRGAFGIRTEDVPNMPEQAEGYDPDPRLTEPVVPPTDPWAVDLVRAFRAFRKRGREKVRADLTRQLAALLTISDDKLGALIDKEAKTGIRAIWTPTADNFFKRVSGGYLDDLHRDLLGLKPEHPTTTTFAKLKKGEKAERLEKLFGNAEFRKAHSLTEAQVKRIDAWLPDEMG
ncbi:ParB/RepB/Spo0J family partition protein [Lutimaribacter marinistellae]|uniref:ParB/RepB/Spo0J family partition protein n=1 Tax=Lutimaribacter marinistellae TaxID=1820329 RepID=A0ABV7TN55_9RHOB